MILQTSRTGCSLRLDLKNNLKEKYGFARTDSTTYFYMILTDQLGKIEPSQTMAVNRPKKVGVNAGFSDLDFKHEESHTVEFEERRVKQPE